MTNADDQRTPSDFTAALGAQLVVAHGRLRRRRRRRQIGSAIASVVLLAFAVTASLSLLAPKPAAADPITVETTSGGDRIVRITAERLSPAELQDALQAKNIENVTVGLTTGPSRVGVLLNVFFDSAHPPHGFAVGRSITIPGDFTGQARLTIGIEAPAGAMYEQPTSVFNAGEPLAGFKKAKDAGAVAAAAAKHGLHVEIFDAAGNDVSTVHTGTPLVDAVMVSSDTVQLHLGT